MYLRKDGLWEEQIYLANGKRKSLYARSKPELKKKLLAWQGEQARGPVLSDALEQWEASREKEVSYKTLEGYKAPLKRIREAFGRERMEDITPAMIQAFIRDIAAKGYKRTTVQRPLDVLRMVYDWQITQPGSAVRTNPCTSVKLPAGLEQQRRDLAAPEDVAKVKAGVTHPFGLFAYLLLYTGLREGEALALKDTDFAGGVISVTKSLSWQTNKPVIKEPKTKASVRQVSILDPLKDVLPVWKGYLFSADGGKSPLTNTEFRARWDGYCRDVGLADPEEVVHRSSGKNNRTYTRTVWHNRIVPHQLRHEFATFCLDAGLDPIDAKDLLGHASEETTRAVYTHIRDSRREKTTVKLNAFLRGNSADTVSSSVNTDIA